MSRRGPSPSLGVAAGVAVRTLRKTASYARLFWRELHRALLRDVFITKPRVINLLANDVCNSRCTMCNIWKRKDAPELSPDELAAILEDPLYSKVEHVGVSGGEPTMRDDIIELFEVCMSRLPSLEGLSLITNAIRSELIIPRVERIARSCREGGVGFSLMVSLDGLGEAHDRIRGIPGNFAASERVIARFKNDPDVQLLTGTTISKGNVWDMDELLYYLKKNDLYGRFRVAEFIKRLYNEDRVEVIRNFDDDETYQLSLFFFKLERSFEGNEMYRRTYRNIRNMLNGGKRTIGCPYHSDGVVLNANGDLQYCAPKSEIIGSSLRASSLRLFKDNIEERKRIRKEHCADCIHDYHSPITLKERLAARNEGRRRALFAFGNTKALDLARSCTASDRDDSLPRVMIVGWYGTETVGDKAILGGIVEHYRRIYPEGCNFVIGSLHPFVTERTCSELALAARVVPTHSLEYLREAKAADHVVIGGGPLMDLDELWALYAAFLAAEGETVVFGCGIGPVYEEKYEKVIQSIVREARVVKVRDHASKQQILEWFPGREVEVIDDPAVGYLSRFQSDRGEKGSTLACYLREWPYEYNQHLPRREFDRRRESFEGDLARFLMEKMQDVGATKIRMHHMHNFVVGDDDRDFSIRFIDERFPGCPFIELERGLSSVASIVRSMQESVHLVCMRYHSVVFAETLGAEYTAIDYTNGGKIRAFLADRGKPEALVTPAMLARTRSRPA